MTISVWHVRFAWAFTGTLCVALVWAFLTPVAELPRFPTISDYFWHIGLFAILVIPLGTTLPAQRIWLVIFALAFGTLLEILQPYFGRGFEVHDLIANALGVALGWFVSTKLAWVLNR